MCLFIMTVQCSKWVRKYAVSISAAQTRKLPMAWGSQRPHLRQDCSLNLGTCIGVTWRRGGRLSLAEAAGFEI